MKFLFKWLFIAILSGLTGCATIDEVDPAKPVELKGTHKAVLKSNPENNNGIGKRSDQLVIIKKLDGQGLYRPGWTSDFPSAILVNPGRHYVDIEYRHFSSSAEYNLWFDALAEKRYTIKKEIKGYGVALWIENEETGEKVGGLVGSEPPDRAMKKPNP